MLKISAYGRAGITLNADEVDRIVADWQRITNRNTESLQIFSRISRVYLKFETLRQAIFARHGLEGWEFDVLAALRRATTHQLTPSELIKETLVTSGTMTARVDKLQNRGLVKKLPALTDGRSVVIELQPEGLQIVDSALIALLEIEDSILENLVEEEQRHLVDLLRQLLSTLEAS